MMETEVANRRGYYLVGAIEQSQNSTVTLENSIILVVPEEAAEKQNDDLVSDSVDKKTYNVDKIRDLQSKLMLIGGKQGREREAGQVEKDCFLRVSHWICLIAITLAIFVKYRFVCWMQRS